MCVIVPFARQRFTPGDLVAWNNILADRQRRGLWVTALRSTGPTFDRLEIWLPRQLNPTLKLERDVAGLYRAYYHDGRGWFLFRSQATMADCLMSLDPNDISDFTGDLTGYPS
jgi:hypothetical protein